MVIKSLTITEEAYDALKVLKHGDESFSEAILRISKEKTGTTAKFCGALRGQTEDIRRSIKESRAKTEKELTERAIRIRRRLA